VSIFQTAKAALFRQLGLVIAGGLLLLSTALLVLAWWLAASLVRTAAAAVSLKCIAAMSKLSLATSA
jgi:hypothetical protein